MSVIFSMLMRPDTAFLSALVNSAGRLKRKALQCPQLGAVRGSTAVWIDRKQTGLDMTWQDSVVDRSVCW